MYTTFNEEEVTHGSHDQSDRIKLKNQHSGAEMEESSDERATYVVSREDR